MLENRVGETNYNSQNEKMTIVEYNGYSNTIVEFGEGERTKCRYGAFKSGQVKNPYSKSIYGVGYFGVGIHRASENSRVTKKYNTWQNMLRRCYCKEYQDSKPTYLNCIVDDSWLNFQTFGDWYDKNYYEVENEEMQLDKDILVKGNKIYSPDTCVFVPRNINILFTKNNSIRGNCPVGVSYDSKGERFVSYCNTGTKTKRTHLGSFKSEREAFYAYKNFKELYIKDIAERYKENIPEKLYDALVKYKVEIND